jgi:hypothetical protein
MFGFETFSANDMVVDCTNFEDISLGTSEKLQVMKSNNSMSQDDLIKSYCYSSQVVALHTMGISDIISIYLNKSKGVTYQNFYEGAIEYLEKDFELWTSELKSSMYNWHNTGIYDSSVGNVKIYSWAIPYIIPMQVHYNQKVPYFIDRIANYVSTNWDIDSEIVDDYKTISLNRVKYWGNYIHEQKVISTKTNLYDYTFNNQDKIIFEEQKYTVDDQYYREYGKNIVEHTEYILYGRQRRWHLHKVNKKDK